MKNYRMSLVVSFFLKPKGDEKSEMDECGERWND